MKLKELILERLEVSVSQFCREIGLSRTTIDNIMNNYEKSPGKAPSRLTIKKICNYFGVDFKEFI